jgi:hypothetical protein
MGKMEILRKNPPVSKKERDLLHLPRLDLIVEKFEQAGGKDRFLFHPQRTENILSEATKRTRERNRQTRRGEKRYRPKKSPIPPPRSEAPKRGRKKLAGGRWITLWVTSPARELITMNPEETSAVSRGVARRRKRRRGLKKIPPPTPIAPDKNPRTDPTGKARRRRGMKPSERFSSGFKTLPLHREKPAHRREAPRRGAKIVRGRGISAPMLAKRGAVKRKGRRIR